jgi:hypothetical protein
MSSDRMSGRGPDRREAPGDGLDVVRDFPVRGRTLWDTGGRLADRG